MIQPEIETYATSEITFGKLQIAGITIVGFADLVSPQIY